MLADADLATTAELMSGHRASLLLALMGGDELAAGELATRAGISPSLASTHLARLLEGRLATVTRHGRERRYRLAGPDVAEAVEAMLRLAPDRRAATLRQANRARAVRHARTCYDHLAGTLGVALTESLERHDVIRATDTAYELTAHGRARLEGLGLDIDALSDRRRAFARPCLDWTERRPHLAGALGAGLAERVIALGWVQRRSDCRALRVTELGRGQLRDQFALNLASTGG